MKELKDLIAKLESAAEGSRELSDEVLLACGWTKHEGGVMFSTARGTAGKADVWMPPTSEQSRLFSANRPCPSTNLQDTVDTVPEGSGVALFKTVSGWAGYVGLVGDYQHGNYSEAATPALALSAAIARAKMEGRVMDPNKDREVQAAFDGYMSHKEVAELMVVREAAARKEAFLDVVGMAQEAAELWRLPEYRPVRDGLLQLAARLHAKAAEQ